MTVIKLFYTDITTPFAQEQITWAATVELFVRFGIDCSQTSRTRLRFESERDALLALVYLSASADYTPRIVA